jgi:hypothetical protein
LRLTKEEQMQGHAFASMLRPAGDWPRCQKRRARRNTQRPQVDGCTFMAAGIQDRGSKQGGRWPGARILAARQYAAEKAGKPANQVQPMDFRVHDLRRPAATIMADRLGVLPRVIETILNSRPRRNLKRASRGK